MNELSEKLKKNERPFGLCSEEEQKCFEEVTKGNCEIFHEDKWMPQTPPNHTDFLANDTFRIKPDYASPPKEIRKPVCDKHSNDGRHPLEEYLSYTNFVCFEYEDCETVRNLFNKVASIWKETGKFRSVLPRLPNPGGPALLPEYVILAE